MIVAANMNLSQQNNDTFFFLPSIFKELETTNYMSFINILQLKTTRNTSVVEQVEFNAHCNDRGCHREPWCVSARGC